MGKLIIVGTPIGNLSDLSLRAIHTLVTAKYVVCEDTRRTSNLINLIHTKLKEEWSLGLPPQVKPRYISYRDQNHEQASQEVISVLANNDVIFTTDSGMPTISDPGFKLVRAVLAQGIVVEAVPGPTAATTALAIGGLPTDKFIFLGFLPKKPGQQRNMLAEYGELPATLVIYESPLRIDKTLTAILEALGDREVAIGFELTKLHEKLLHGKTSELLSQLNKKTIKGEVVILVAKQD